MRFGYHGSKKEAASAASFLLYFGDFHNKSIKIEMYKEGVFMKKSLIYSALILLALSISACGHANTDIPMSSAPQESSEEEDPPIIDNSGFKNINDEEPFEIHTEQQKKFLEYEGKYAKMCSISADKAEYLPDGKSHLSDSLPITFTWNYELPEGKEVEKYSVVFGQNKDLSDGYKVDGGKEDTISFNNPYLGRNYYQLIATFTDGTTDETPIRHFEVDSTYPRNLTIAGMTNCRDIGGRETVDGGRIKQGLIFRTSGKNQNGSLTDATTEEMINHLKLKNEINLAGDSNSYNLKLAGTTLFEGSRMDTSSTGGYSHISRNAEAAKNFFNFIADENNYPLYYHCKIGTDRTGVCTILLQGLLGVSYENIYQDYLFSNFGKIGEQRTIGDGNSHDIRKYMDDFMSYSGEKFQNKVYNILLGIGVAKETLDHIIDNLVEGNKPQGNNADQVIARADILTGNGVEVTTDTSVRNNPDNYFALDSDAKSVSYTFTSEKAYKGQVVAYLANPDTAQTDTTNKAKKMNESLSVELDNAGIELKDQSWYDARMAVCKQPDGVKRPNYWPVILGTVDVTAGSHTIVIKGTSSANALNLGGIYIYDDATAGGLNGFEA